MTEGTLAPATPKKTLAMRILAALSQQDGLSDHDLAMTLDGHAGRMARIGTECRYLSQNQQLCKQMRADGIMGNFLVKKLSLAIPRLQAGRI